MGGWEQGTFENDDALDFVSILDERNLQPIELFSVISQVANIPDSSDPDYGPDAYDSQRALAAIELVAAAKGRPAPGLPPPALNWLQKHSALAVLNAGNSFGGNRPGIVELCRIAIHQIRTNSELKDLREAGSNYSGWEASLTDLEERLREHSQAIEK